MNLMFTQLAIAWEHLISGVELHCDHQNIFSNVSEMWTLLNYIQI